LDGAAKGACAFRFIMIRALDRLPARSVSIGTKDVRELVT
jgi:hypothetical protein